jgi:dihydrodipicolinate synthase/N-acetylneuraminate lyase
MPARDLFRGVVVPMVTPFTTDGSIDEPAVDRIVTYLVNGGVHGIFPLGTTGEAASIHAADKRRLITATVRSVARRAVIYAGIAANSFRESIGAAKAYGDAGVNALVAHMPSYYPLTDDQIETYFLRLADQVPLPLVLYNISATTHQSIPLDAIDRLRQHPNIVALKDSANDADRISDLLRLTGGRDGFPVLIGNSAQFAHGLKHGAAGLVPSGAHLVPELYRAIFEAAMAGRWTEVEQLQHQTDAVCARYLKGRTLGQGLAALKALLEERGLCSRTMLPPLSDHSGAV